MDAAVVNLLCTVAPSVCVLGECYVWFLFCIGVLSVITNFAIILMRK